VNVSIQISTLFTVGVVTRLVKVVSYVLQEDASVHALRRHRTFAFVGVSISRAIVSTVERVRAPVEKARSVNKACVLAPPDRLAVPVAVWTFKRTQNTVVLVGTPVGARRSVRQASV
tara:strand:+ start:2441 stop:2791 length:351 start_codon:yes stop_codon:yes gene_type:complete